MKKDAILQSLGFSKQAPVTVRENQSVEDIMNLITYKHRKCAADYDRIASYFWAGSVEKTCKAIFDFLKRNVYYQIETEDIQTIRSPKVILEKGVGDCKHYALFAAGVLDALTRSGKKIDWYYRYASYNILDDTPVHVFVVVKQPDGSEIWIDPVLKDFNYHKPYQYARDRKVRPGQISGVGRYYVPSHLHHNRSRLGLSVMSPKDCVKGIFNEFGSENLGATTAQTGALITKISASVAAVPVYPFTAIIGAAGAVVGFFLQTFGSRYASSTQVRWLAQLFKFYVVGDPTATSDNKVSDADVAPAQKWFALVLGVPVYDRYRFNSLAGKTGDANIDQSLDNRIKDYLRYPEVQAAGVTYAQASEAAQIAGSLPLNSQPGAWRNATPAPSLISPTGTSAASGPLKFLSGMNPLLMIGLIGAGLFMLFGNKKHGHA